MKKILSTLIGFAALGFAGVSSASYQSVDYLRSISGNYTVSGMHNNQKNPSNTPASGYATYYTDRVKNITGKYPALWSGDFLFHGRSDLRWEVTYAAEKQWNAGSLVNIMWHACPPTQAASCGWNGGILSHLSDAQWNDLITDGGYLNGVWKSRMDEIAIHLQYLKSKNVEVLWRPLHEMNQGVFWWGGRTGPNGSRRLYQLTHDYLVNVRGLTNLIWVWDVQDLSSNYADYNPGSNYWDIGALDIYGDGFTNPNYYNTLVSQAAGKPIGIGEAYHIPTVTELQNQPRMAFFMQWPEDPGEALFNSNQNTQNTYNSARVITQDEMPGWSRIATPVNNSAITIQAENFSNMSGVLMETTTDEGGGQNIGYVDTGDWLSYAAINIPTSGTYTIAYRVAATEAGGRLQFEQAGGASYGAIDIPVTGGWQNWTTIYQTVTLTAGTQNFGLKALGGGWNINWFSITPTGVGTVQAESFSNMSGVIQEGTTDVGGGLNIGSIDSNDWLSYSTITIPTSGNYLISYRVASLNGGGVLQFEQAGGASYGSINIPGTGGWQNWTTIYQPVSLSAGVQDFGIKSLVGGWNLNWFAISPTTTVQAESYSNMFGVAKEPASDIGGGQDIGAVDAGDWLSYSNINIPVAGNYIIAYRVASVSGGGRLQFEQAGGSSYGAINIPSTGGWQNWTTIYQTVSLNAGQQNFGIKALVGGFNLNWFSISQASTITAANNSATGGIGAFLSKSQFEQIFPNRDPFYTYEGLVTAANSYPAFAQIGTIDTRKREVAAALANFAHETGGLRYITEINKSNSYCDFNTQYPCAPGKQYYGRGPIQLSHNGNYGAAGDALGMPLLSNPDLVAQNAMLAWQTAIWYWMTQTGGTAQTSHDAMINGLGFGATINNINGALECNGRNTAAVNSRINNYTNFINILGVTAGPGNIGC